MNIEIEFTDEEIREELAKLGYENVPVDKLAEFKKDLMKLIHSERSRNTSMASSGDEQRDELPSQISHEEGHEGAEYGGSNFTNHGSQWIGNGMYHEDWHYRGKSGRAQETRPKSAAPRVRVPGSYGLYELPESARYQQDDNNSFMDRPATVEANPQTRTRCGGPRISDQFRDEDTVGIFEIYEKIKSLAVRDCECQYTKKKEPPYRIVGENKTPSVIITKPKNEHPHTRNLVRTNPGDRMKMYEKCWKKHPAIGDDDRNNLKKMVHAKLLKKQEVIHDKKIYVPNTYVVPTNKLRRALRWQVRTAMENFEMPPTGIYHDM